MEQREADFSCFRWRASCAFCDAWQGGDRSTAMEGEKSVDPLTGEAGRPSVDEEAAKRKKMGRKKLVDDTANQAKKLEEHPVWKAARHGSAAEFRRAVAATPKCGCAFAACVMAYSDVHRARTALIRSSRALSARTSFTSPPCTATMMSRGTCATRTRRSSTRPT